MSFEDILATIDAFVAAHSLPDSLDTPMLSFLRMCAGERPRTHGDAIHAFARPDMGDRGAVYDADGKRLEISGEQWAGASLPCSQPHDMYHMLFSYLYSISWNGRLPHEFAYSATFVNEPPPITCAAFAATLELPHADAITRRKFDLVRRLWRVYETPRAELALLCPPIDAIRSLWRDLSHSDVLDAPPKWLNARPVLLACLCAVLYMPAEKPQVFDHVRRPAELEVARAANVRNRAVGLFGSAGLGYGVNVLPYLTEHGAMRAVSAEIANAVGRQPPWYSLRALVEPLCDSPDMHSSLLARLIRALIR